LLPLWAIGVLDTALVSLGAAMTWVRGQLMLTYITMLLNPWAVALGVVIALVFWLMKASGSWADFVAQWKYGIQEMGIFFEKWLLKPMRDLLTGLEKLASIGGKKKEVNSGISTLPDDINNAPRVDRAGNLIGKGMHLPGTGMGEVPEVGKPVVMPTMPPGFETLMSGDAGQRIGSGSPADMQAMLQAAMSKDMGPVSFDYVRFAEEVAKRPMTGNVMLDGQKVGEILSSSSRTAAARAGVPVNYSE
jgi:hypothetical protein